MLHTIKSNKLKRIFLLAILVIPLLAFSLHKEYYSLTRIDYNKKEKALQITMRLFTNDMEFALNKQYEKPLELGTDIEIKDADKLLNIYLNQKFSIRVNDKPTTYNFIGKEFEKDVMYIYLEVINIDTIHQIDIHNSVLTESFKEQENIIKIAIDDQQKSLILTKENDKGLLKF
jgi:hypothetical protein